MAIPDVLAGLDVRAPGFYLRPDYYEVLAWLREHEPVRDAGDGLWLVSRYEDVRDISRRPDVFSSRHGALVNDPVRRSGPDDEAGSILHLDPPLHADYRRLLNREFTPRAVARMEHAIRRTVTAVFDELGAGDEIDLVERVASPIPVAVIAELLGITGDLADFRRWSDATIEVTDNQAHDVLSAVAEFLAFLDGHVRRRTDSPGDDLLSLLLRSTVGGRPLTHEQVMMFCLTLVVAGNETTRSLLSGGALALAEHPDERRRLVEDPALIPAAVEECLRWVSPIQAFCRTATVETSVGGVRVPEGAYLVLLYASANRDPAAFGPTAERFDVGRPLAPTHLAFGFGEHLCLGASLARLEARIVFEELLGRHPGYEVDGEPVYVPSTLTRSLGQLPVVLRS